MTADVIFVSVLLYPRDVTRLELNPALHMFQCLFETKLFSLEIYDLDFPKCK